MKLILHKNPKINSIAHTLTRNGVTIWHTIPEQIIQDLHDAGYKIKKRKRFKNIIQSFDTSTPSITYSQPYAEEELD